MQTVAGRARFSIMVRAETPCWNPNVAGVPQADLGPEFRCGYLTVPENRSKPDGKTIKVGVAIAKAASATPQKEPLLYLNGGPGGTSIASAATWVKGGMTADRDVIFIDQRGAYHAEPFLSCPDLDNFANTLATRSFLAPETRTAAEKATKAAATRSPRRASSAGAGRSASSAAKKLRTSAVPKHWPARRRRCRTSRTVC